MFETLGIRQKMKILTKNKFLLLKFVLKMYGFFAFAFQRTVS
jgi:hypothetical protein